LTDLAECEAWIEGRGQRLTGPLTVVKERPWSTVLEAPTDAGRVFMKMPSAATAFEPALNAALARWEVPGVQHPLAVDLDRGWMLLPDGGKTMRELPPAETLPRWPGVIERYAELQVAVCAHAEQLLALRVPDARLERGDELVAELGSPHQAELLERMGTLRERLERVPVPPSIQHDDLHDANVFLTPGGPVFFDWGDACVTHPFMSLTVAFSSIAFIHDLAPGDAVFARLRAAYLVPWAEFGSPQQLEDALDAAIELGALWRALTYRRLIAALPGRSHPVLDGGDVGWTEQFLGLEAADA
jgi:hypothetical protein